MKLKFFPFFICTLVTFIAHVCLILLTEVPIIIAASDKDPFPFSFVVICSLSSLIALLSPVAIGLLYPISDNQKETLSIQNSILGSGLSVMVASFLSTLFLVCFRWLVLLQLFPVLNPKLSEKTFLWLMDVMGGISQLLLGANASKVGVLLPAGMLYFGVMGAIGGAVGTLLVTKGKFRRRVLT